MPTNEYETHAQEVADKIGITVEAVYTGNECPPWRDGKGPKSARSCPRCGTIHGDRFLVTVTKGSRVLTFPFWASSADCYVERYPRGGREVKEWLVKGFPGQDPTSRLIHVKHTPSCYDILACLSSDATMPTDPDEVVAEFGEMKPSQAVAIADFARKVQAFFTADEIELLSEVS